MKRTLAALDERLARFAKDADWTDWFLAVMAVVLSIVILRGAFS